MDPGLFAEFQKQLNEESHWQAQLCFDLSEVGDGTYKVNLLSVIPPEENEHGTGYRFPPQRFPANWESRGTLIKALQLAAVDQGYEIVTESSKVKHQYVQLGCPRRRIYRPPNKGQAEFKGQYKENIVPTFLQDSKRKGSRGKAGQSQPRKAETALPRCKEEACKFNFTVKLQHGAWYIQQASGDSFHHGHTMKSMDCIRARTNLMSEEETARIAQLIDHSAGTGVTRNIMREDNGHTLTRQQCRFIYQKERGKGNTVELSSQTDAETLLTQMREMQQKGEGSFVALYHTVLDTSLIAERGKGRPRKNVTTVDGNDDVVVSELGQLEAEEIDEMLTPLRLHLKVGNKILLAIVWVMKENVRMYQLFPEILYGDCTAQSNKEGRPLFTLVGKNSEGEAFMALEGKDLWLVIL